MELDLASLREGGEIPGRLYTASPERLQWYGNATMTASTGSLKILGSNIHTDRKYAKEQGLPDAVADGMIMANLLSSMLLKSFGHHYLESGELRCKFIRPVLVDVAIAVKGRVDSIKQVDADTREVKLTVWCEDMEGGLKTEGDARVLVRNDA